MIDNNLKIHTFTSNCVDILKLNSNIINSNYDITSFIKQLNESNQAFINEKDYTDSDINEIASDDNLLLKLNENESNKNVNSIINKSIENNIKKKEKILKSFLYPKKVTWRIENNILFR